MLLGKWFKALLLNKNMRKLGCAWDLKPFYYPMFNSHRLLWLKAWIINAQFRFLSQAVRTQSLRGSAALASFQPLRFRKPWSRPWGVPGPNKLQICINHPILSNYSCVGMFWNVIISQLFRLGRWKIPGKAPNNCFPDSIFLSSSRASIKKKVHQNRTKWNLQQQQKNTTIFPGRKNKVFLSSIL